jgi:tRNA pseudouridine32 synthase/23S rRNA pseudouridine746 synthase
VTGRTHQLRVHLQSIGHPILGDHLYASPGTMAKSARLLLHASQLTLTHPLTGETLDLYCKVPF